MQRKISLQEYPKQYSRPTLFNGNTTPANTDINATSSISHNVDGSFMICQRLLQSWLASLSNVNRNWDRELLEDTLITRNDFKTFGITIPNTKTRATLKDGEFSIFDCDIISETHESTEAMRIAAPSLTPSNIPVATNPAIAKNLYAKIIQLAASNPSLSVDIICDEPSGFAFTVTGDLSLLVKLSVSGNAADEQSAATPGYTLRFTLSRPMVKGKDYTADDLGHVTFLTKPYGK